MATCQYPVADWWVLGMARSRLAHRRSGSRLRASPAAHRNGSGPSSSPAKASRTARSSPGPSGRSLRTHVTESPSRRASSWRAVSSATVITACAGACTGRSSKNRPIAGSAVSSPTSSIAEISGGRCIEDFGPTKLSSSPGRAARAQAAAGPCPCSTKSRVSSPASASTARGV